MKKVIIVLGWSITALSTLRALRDLKKEGYMLVAASTVEKGNMAMQSNIPQEKIVFREGLTKGLLDVANRWQEKPILLFTSDSEVVEVNENREELTKHYRFMLSEALVIDAMMEKVKFARFAQEKKLSIPKTVIVEDPKDLENIASQLDYPIMVKPYLLHSSRVNNDEELALLQSKLEPLNYHSMVVQEYIEGEDDNVFFGFMVFDNQGEVVRFMTGKKLRQWPISYGTGSLAKTLYSEALTKEVLQFVDSVELKGYCSIEFKYDARNDRYCITEPTIGRFDQKVALTCACGVNFPEAIVRLLEGETLPEAKQKLGVYWIYESNDAFSFFNSKTNYGYFKNFFKPHIKVLFSWRDPWPLFFEIKSLFQKKLKKTLRYG